jgi:NADH-quinone oxidoreductase subunit N
MSIGALFAAAPLIVLALAGLVCLLALSFSRRKASSAFAVCSGGLALGLASSIFLSLPRMGASVSGLLSMDGLSFIGTTIILACSLAIALASRPHLARREGERGEYYSLLLFAALGGCVLASAASLATIFLGLELLSVSLYALVAYGRASAEAEKAAFTYLILASAASAFLLFGMGLAYYQCGSLDLARITRAAADSPSALWDVSFAMVGIGFAFKLALAPFHMWAPEVYEGASAGAAAVVATVSKAAMVLPLARILALAETAGTKAGPAIVWTVAALAGASMVAGNLLALREERVKRMLAGSSIAQLGYLLVALAAGGVYGRGTALFYLAAYTLSTLGAFSCVAALSWGEAPRELFRGLAGRRPLVAAVMTASLLSLAGMPLTAGFVGKFLLFGAGARSGTATRILVFLLAVNSALSMFYYLRLVSLMYRKAESVDAEAKEAGPSQMAAKRAKEGSLLAGAALALVGLAILAIGLAPGGLIEAVSTLISRG